MLELALLVIALRTPSAIVGVRKSNWLRPRIRVRELAQCVIALVTKPAGRGILRLAHVALLDTRFRMLKLALLVVAPGAPAACAGVLRCTRLNVSLRVRKSAAVIIAFHAKSADAAPWGTLRHLLRFWLSS